MLAAKRWSSADYLAGYALECAFKSCILAHIEKTGVIFEQRKYAEKCWTHDFEDLLKLANLEADHQRVCGEDQTFARHWDVVKDWSESSRYRIIKKPNSEAFLEAMAHKSHGVLAWIRHHW